MAATSTRRRSPRVPPPVSVQGIVGQELPPAAAPAPITHSGLAPLSTRVPPELKREMKLLALQHDVTLQDAIAEACREWVARRRPDH